MVDILLASYNGEPYIAEQLDSLFNQTYPDIRIILRDDASTDRTLAIAKAYAGRYPDRLKVLVNEKGTGSAMRNFFRMLSDTDAEYVMFCDQDDVWTADKVECTLRHMKEAEREAGAGKPVLVHTDLAVVDAQGKVLSPSFHRYMNLGTGGELSQLIIQNQVTGCTVMVNQPLVQLMKMAEDVDRIVMHDHWAALVAAAFGVIRYVDEPTVRYRQHGNNTVGAKNAGSLSYLYGRFRQGKKQFRRELSRLMKQADYFLAVYASCGMKEADRFLIQEYAALRHKKKAKRVSFYLRHRVLKHGMICRIMQILWG